MNMLQVIKAGAEKAVAADPKPLNQSRTMQAIARAVESLPPFPLSAPLPVIGTSDQYADEPCSTPQARYMPRGVCHCGFLMGEHSKGGVK